MINSNWIVAPVDVANQNFEDVFYLDDIQKNIQIQDFIDGTDDNIMLKYLINQILIAEYGEYVTVGSVYEFISPVTKGRAKVILEQINAGLISH